MKLYRPLLFIISLLLFTSVSSYADDPKKETQNHTTRGGSPRTSTVEQALYWQTMTDYYWWPFSIDIIDSNNPLWVQMLMDAIDYDDISDQTRNPFQNQPYQQLH